jgi:hypothetical protein
MSVCRPTWVLLLQASIQSRARSRRYDVIAMPFSVRFLQLDFCCVDVRKSRFSTPLVLGIDQPSKRSLPISCLILRAIFTWLALKIPMGNGKYGP